MHIVDFHCGHYVLAVKMTANINVELKCILQANTTLCRINNILNILDVPELAALRLSDIIMHKLVNNFI
jgi:hypothetical protein